MSAKETVLTKVDKDKIQQLIATTETSVAYFNDIVKGVVEQYSHALDSLMSDLYVECIRDENATTTALENYYLELSNMIYFMIEKQEQLSVYASMARSASKEAYSKSYLDSQVKDAKSGKNLYTVAELQSMANIDTQYDEVLATVYEHAYKVIKGKIESGKDMMNTLRKIISHRMSEEQLSMYGNTKLTRTTSEEIDN